MRKILFTILLIFCIFNNASAETVIRVGYVPNTGFLEESVDGHYYGYGYEYMEFLSCYGNWKFEYIPSTTWQECNAKLQNGEIDILPAMPGDYRTLQNVTRTDHVIGRYPMALITKDGSIKPQMRLGTIISNAPIPSLPKVAANEGFTYELTTYNLFYDMEESFKRNELDGYIAPMFEPNKEKNVAAIFDRQSYRLLVKTDRTDLLAAMNTAMDEMLMDQPNIRNRLNDKYLRSGGSPLILSRQEKEYLSQKKKLKTAIVNKNKPYAYENNSELFGVIPRLIDQISKDLGIEIEIVDTKTPDEAYHLIQTGQIDFIADAICDFSWASKFNMKPTQSYLLLEYVPAMKRGISLEEATIVACDPNQLYTKKFIFPYFAEEYRIYADNLEECFQLLNEGTADIVFAPRSEVQYLIDEVGNYTFEVAAESDFSEEISLGVYAGADYKLWRILNKEVNHLDIIKIRNSMDDWIVSTTNLNPKWLIYHYPIRAMAIMAIIAGIIAAAVWYRIRLRKKHINIVHNMAYTDSRYNLPNLIYLQREIPKIIFGQNDSDEKFYIVNFAAFDKTSDNFTYDKELRNEQLVNMAENLNAMDFVILTSTGDERGSLICLCKAKNEIEITQNALEAVKKFGYLETKNSRLNLNMKTGICEVDRRNFIQSIENAQIACRRAEEDVLLFNSKMQENLTLEENIEAKMEESLKNGEFQIWYQPIYDLKTKKAVGMEAFVRWQSSELGFLLPEKFLPIFERNGFILQIDYFVLEEVCKLQRKNIDEKIAILPISINQSSLHFTEEHYISKVKSIIKKYKLPKGIIKLEFGELAFSEAGNYKQIEKIEKTIRALQNLGLKISIDDFGNGYSSYKLLNDVKIDEIKIDRSILESSTKSKRMKEILNNIIKLGASLKIAVICEGIETKEQENLLVELNCHYGQGFLHSELTNGINN